MTVTSREVTTTTKTTTTYTPPAVKFAEGDDVFPYRLVGSYEYGKSLGYLGELADTSTSEEISVYDKLISENPEYAFYSGVALNYGLQPNVAEMDAEQVAELDKNCRQSSLAWMMALARVELGATVAMYGEQEDPFGVPVAIGGTEFGAEEYLKVLVDDLAAHLKAAVGDQRYHNALNPKLKVDNGSLAFLRRTQLIDALLDKVMSSGEQEVMTEVAPYAEKAEEYVDTMIDKIEYAVSPETQTRTSIESDTVTDSQITGVRFQNRQSLLACQRALESRFPAPETSESPLDR